MKIDFVTPLDVIYSTRGTEKHLYEYALFLDGNGMEARVLVPRYANLGRLKKIEGYRELEKRYGSLEKIGIYGRKFSLPFKYDLYSYEGIPGDSIVYFPFSPYSHILNIIAKPRGQVYVIGSHSLHLKKGRLLVGKSFLEYALNGLMRLALRGEETRKNVYYHTLTGEQTRYLKETLGIGRDRIICVPNFIETGRFRTGGNRSRSLQVLHIGGIQKDSGAVISIMDLLAKRGLIGNFVFHFIGGDQPEGLANYERAGNAVLHGKVGNAEKVRLLSEMDALVMPAVEAFSVTLLEGMASGLYVVSRDNYYANEIKEKGAHIALAAPGDIAGYCEALLGACRMKRKGRLKGMGMENRRIAERFFGKQAVLKQIRAMFEKIIASGGADPRNPS